MPYILTPQQVQDLRSHASSQLWSEFYNSIYELSAYSDATGQTLEDPNVREWFRVASIANSGEGVQSDLIRNYTANQVELRTGIRPTDLTLQAASNAIANAIFLNHIDLSGQLPTLEDIRDIDAPEVVSALQQAGHVADLSIWSGNLLFVGLGDLQPLRDNLLSGISSYDLFASGNSIRGSGLGNLFAAGFDSFFSSLSLAGNLGSAVEAQGLVDDYLTDTYGAYAPSAVELFAGRTIVDNEGNSSNVNAGIELEGGSGTDSIHADGGDDRIIGSIGSDLIDGGSGSDTVSFEFESQFYGGLSTTLSLFSVSGSSAAFSGLLEWDGEIELSRLYEIEKASLGIQDDVLYLSSITALESVNALEQDNVGDLIDVADAASGVLIDLHNSQVVMEGQELEVINFENVFGSDFDDEIIGTELNNIVDGKDGDDLIDGRSGFNALSGGFGADTFRIDLQPNERAPQILWGGDGGDICEIETAGDDCKILMLDVPNLGTDDIVEFYSLFSKNADPYYDLGFEYEGQFIEFNSYDVILLNPEEIDKLYIDGNLVSGASRQKYMSKMTLRLSSLRQTRNSQAKDQLGRA